MKTKTPPQLTVAQTDKLLDIKNNLENMRSAIWRIPHELTGKHLRLIVRSRINIHKAIKHIDKALS